MVKHFFEPLGFNERLVIPGITMEALDNSADTLKRDHFNFQFEDLICLFLAWGPWLF